MKQPKFNGSTNLEQALDILPVEGEIIDDDSDDMELIPVEESDIVEQSNLTEPDQEIRDDITELYDRAIQAFDDNDENIESLDPKYVSRAMEVNRQYLDTALSAIKLKQQQKEHADRMELELTKIKTKNSSKTGDTINNTLIVADRNEILKRIKGENSDES